MYLAFDSCWTGRYDHYGNGSKEVTPQGLVLKEIHPEFTVEQVKAATEAALIIADDLKPMAV